MDSEDFKSLQDRISSSLVATTRTAGQISAEDLPFQRSLDPEIASSLDYQNERLLGLASRLVGIVTSGTEVEAPLLHDADALENNWRGVVDVVDSLLEKADTSLDEYTGIIKRSSPAQQEQTLPKPSMPRTSKSLRNQNISKPQLLFDTVPTNDEKTPFKPLLYSKPHATVPLDQSMNTFVDERGSIEYRHPYETEITQFGYPPSTYVRSEPIPYSPLEGSSATFVDTPEELAAMLNELKTAKEIAVDLEHHDTRSYVGIVSLMQISTRNRDWIVDTLKPWRRKLQVLNEVFTNPNILKVFHGAFMDIVWLQRDFGLYVVGLFDTFHAARELGYPKASLAALLLKFAKFNAKKQYQMADWRIRPLPDEMAKYARSDTHFLLYVYDHLRNELIDKSNQTDSEQNSIDVVLEKSKETALDRYSRQAYDREHGTGSSGWYSLLNRTPALFTREQFAVFRAIHHWRDSVAREEDESLHYVMPKQVMFNIARAMPIEKSTLLSVSQPITPLVRSRAGELLAVIRSAQKTGAQGPEMIDVLRPQNEVSLQTMPVPSASSNAPVRQTQPIEDDTSAVFEGDRPVRSASSRFWGASFGSSVWKESKRTAVINEGLRLALPLPQLTAEIFKDPRNEPSNEDAAAISNPGARAEHQFVKTRPPPNQSDPGVFIIKELGTARKRKAGNMQEQDVAVTGSTQAAADLQEPAADEIQVSLDDEDAQQKARLKAERKAAKRAKKKLEKEGTKGNQANAVVPDDTRNIHANGQPPESFDYANAESVLHAKRDNTERNGSKRSFDPYSKSADAPKGMRKTKKEKAGKSFTFKN